MRPRLSILVLDLSVVSCSTPERELPAGPRMSRQELLEHVPSSQMERATQSGSVRRWTNNSDGTASITRLPRPGAKAGSFGRTTGKWHISEEGKYCLDEDWKTEAGGPVSWCRFVYQDASGKLHLMNDEPG